MKLIIGLGNPGQEYKNTRHNVGFYILDRFVGNSNLWKQNDLAEYTILTNENSLNKDKIIFIKPTTFMNASGKAVKHFLKYYKVDVGNILVIHDDLDLSVGNYKLKRNSSAGGHNGVASVIEALGTNAFLRLKVGISRPEKGDTVSYVLKKINKKELQQIDQHMIAIHEIITEFINGNSAEQLMNKYN